MKSRLKNTLYYILVVIVPTLIGILYYLNNATDKDYKQKIEHAKWVASIHERSLDQFISETVTSLDVLSLTAETVIDSPKTLEPLIQKMHWQDSRYGGIYILNNDGRIIVASNTLIDENYFIKEEYIKEIKRTKNIIISNYKEHLVTGQRVIGIGKPVLDETGQIKALIVAHIRIDYIQNIMRLLTPDTRLSVLNPYGTSLMDINMNKAAEFDKDHSLTIPINRIPWSINVAIPQRDNAEIIKNAIPFIVSLIFICHILFLIIKYFMLKREAQQIKKENELQKIELVGTLAASTAHEIRNPLTGIKGLVQLLSERHTDSKDQFYFSVINDEISRINEIVSEFLILGKPTAQKTEVIDLRKIVKDIEPIIISEANLNKVQYESFIPENPIFVECTTDQLKQILLNITKNAFEAMMDGGELVIKLKKLPNNCKITITDTGSGIPDEDIEKIFQPFYTSKDLGTGLGLVICKRIVESFGGEIFITSKIGKGTQVDIFLPLKINQVIH